MTDLPYFFYFMHGQSKIIINELVIKVLSANFSQNFYFIQDKYN